MSRPSAGSVGSPGLLWAISGQGLGLAAQKAANSSAQSAGRIARLACRWPRAMPVVTVVCRPALISARRLLASMLVLRPFPFRKRDYSVPAMRAGEIVFTGMDRVVFGRPAAEAAVEAADRLGAERVFILAGKTLNQKTDAVANIAKALGPRFAGLHDDMPAHSPRDAVVACANK